MLQQTLSWQLVADQNFFCDNLLLLETTILQLFAPRVLKSNNVFLCNWVYRCITTGIPGYNGADGEVGEDSKVKGPRGYRGPKGATGHPGVSGAGGLQGRKGDRGKVSLIHRDDMILNTLACAC